MVERSPKVFISYSHDSKEHSERVLELANRLRSDGVEAWIDQYELAPEMGWPRWMQAKVAEADFVLVVASPTYKRRFEGLEEPGKGLGVSWEGLILTQTLYESSGSNKKIIPVVFDGEHSEESIPTPLRPFTRVTLPGGYEFLLRQLYRTPSTVPPLGRVPELPTKSVGSLSGRLSPRLELKLDANIDDAKSKITQLEKALRKLTGSDDVFITEIKEGSARLQISGDTRALALLEKLIYDKKLSDLAGLNVIRIDRLEVTEESGPPWLTDTELKQIFKAADRLGLGDDGFRVTLLGGLPAKVRKVMPVAAPGAAQLLADLRYLNDLPRLADGTAPIHTWLETAELLKEDFEDASIFHQALLMLGIDR